MDANGRIILRKDAQYKTSYWPLSPHRDLFQDRTVSFSVNVPVPTPAVTSVFVRHHSTGGCEHDWSLQYALDWVIYKIVSTIHVKANPPSEVGRVQVGAPKGPE